jgi:hypothetical protein
MKNKFNIRKLLFITLITIGFIHIFSNEFFIQADAAPPPGAVGSTLFPNQNQTQVRMEAETVLMAIPENSDYWSGHAIVTATFYMRNMGDETEEMKVRFPMNMNEYDLRYEVANGEDYCQAISNYPSLENLSVKINGEESNFSTKTTIYTNQFASQGESTTSRLNCWAYFDVSFPPGEQVIIEVGYIAYGYKAEDRFVSYKYILQTGEGWYGTIGSADIVVKLPYALDDTIVRSCQPDDCVIEDKTVSWHYEDFEPTKNIEIEMIDPSIWSKVVRETLNTQFDASDGEAWGRLGMAYKELITDRHGFISAADYPQFFEKSVKAYQNAVYILPNDADWHVGYADLVCPYAVESFLSGKEDTKKYAHICGVEIDTGIYLRPSDPGMIQYLKFLYNTYPEFFVEFGFNIFAEKMHVPTLAPIPTKNPMIDSITPAISDTAPAISPTALFVIKTNTPDVSSEGSLTTPVNPFADVEPQAPYDDGTSQKKQEYFSFFGNSILLAMVFVITYFKQRK